MTEDPDLEALKKWSPPDESESLTLDEAMELLAILYYDMHPTYGSTSRRGRGIGGQAVTQQCNVVDPEGWEVAFNERVEEALHKYVETTAGFTGRTALVVHGLRRKVRADAVTVAEADLRIDLYSNAAPYPFTKSTLIVTHMPSGMRAKRELYEHSMPKGNLRPTQGQARLQCIEEIIDKLKERILNGQ
jgi:hypothetical protein